MMNRFVPEKVKSFSNKFVSIDSGQHHTMALDNEGKIQKELWNRVIMPLACAHVLIKLVCCKFNTSENHLLFPYVGHFNHTVPTIWSQTVDLGIN